MPDDPTNPAEDPVDPVENPTENPIEEPTEIDKMFQEVTKTIVAIDKKIDDIQTDREEDKKRFDKIEGALNVMKELKTLQESIKETVGGAREGGEPAPPEIEYKGKLVELIKGARKLSNKPEDRQLMEAIGAVSAGSAIPEIWAAEIERLHVYPKSIFLTGGFVNWKEELTGKPGDTVHVITVEKIVAVDAVAGDEPTISAAPISSVPVTLKEIEAAYYITKSDLEDVVPSTVDALNDGLGTGLAEKVDTDFFTWLDGLAACAGTLDVGAAMTGSAIAEAKGSMEAGTYDPVALLVGPQAHASLTQDEQFTNAAKYGARDVITRGFVADYLDIAIFRTPLLGGADGGSYTSWLLAQGAVCGAVKRQPDMESDYSIKDRRQYVISTMRFGGTMPHPDGIFKITTVD